MIEPKHLLAWLVQLGDKLEVETSIFANAETTGEITYIEPTMSVDRFVNIGVDLFGEGKRLFAGSLAVCCRIADMEMFNLTSEEWELQIRALTKDVSNDQTLEFELEIDKAKLWENFGIDKNPGQEITLFFWFDAFDRLFREGLCSPNVFEDQLWRGNGTRKAIVLILSESLIATGTHFAILGGDEINSLPTLGGPPQNESERASTIFSVAKETIRWESDWLTFLTPLHLLSNCDDLDPKYADLIAANSVNLGLLFTADRVRRNDTEFTATYATDIYRSEVTGFQPHELPHEIASKPWDVFVELALWSVEDRWQSDRLKLLQSAFASAMASRGQRSDAMTLLDHVERVNRDVHWRWKTFVDGKISSYIDQETDLESEVVETVESFNDQSTRMIGSLSTTVLAAVGVFIGSILLAMFKDGFNANVFALGVGTYIAYIVFLPGIYNMTHHWVTYQSVCVMFEGRLERFKRLLGQDACNEIVGEHVNNAKLRFVRWFGATIVALLVVIALAFVALYNGAALISPSKSTSGPAKEATACTQGNEEIFPFGKWEVVSKTASVHKLRVGTWAEIPSPFARTRIGPT